MLTLKIQGVLRQHLYFCTSSLEAPQDADVCWHMLAYADTGLGIDPDKQYLRLRMLTYADVCWRMQTTAWE